MHESLAYIQTRHPYGDFAGQPSQAPDPNAAVKPKSEKETLTNGQHAQDDREETPPPQEPAKFNYELREAARKLVLQEQAIELVIKSLPGIDRTEADQERKMRELEVELREVERKRARAEEEKETMVDLLGHMIMGAKRVP